MRVRERGSLFFVERESERETEFARARERESAREREKERVCDNKVQLLEILHVFSK